jgi:hypothetical protein
MGKVQETPGQFELPKRSKAMNKISYVSVGGWKAKHLSVHVVRENNDGLRTDHSWRAFSRNENPTTLDSYYSDAHAIVRARRMAWLLMFFVEKSSA